MSETHETAFTRTRCWQRRTCATDAHDCAESKIDVEHALPPLEQFAKVSLPMLLRLLGVQAFGFKVRLILRVEEWVMRSLLERKIIQM